MDVKKTPKKPATSTNQAAPAATPEPTQASAPQATKKNNGMAVAALILVIIGIFVPGLSIIGIILAIVALVQTKKTNEGGRGMAIAALVIAIIEILLGAILLFVVMFAFNKALKDNGVNVNNGSVNVTGKNGESLSVGNAKVPDGFPSDVPIYKPSDVILSLKTKEGYNVTLATSDSAQQVSDYYQTQMVNNGWTKDDTGAVFNANVVQSYSKGDSQVELLIGSNSKSTNDKKTTVSITYVNKANSSQ
ncbi:MAG: DUF4190 domain-containing protein [Candidatus Saccharibacteria bacterium]